MRVIAGSARGMRLQAPRDQSIRPTSDRLRETVFSVVGDRIVDADVWDVCAGTGAIGIEALSRGARRVVFGDESGSAVTVLEQNLRHTRMTDRAEVVLGSWRQTVTILGNRGIGFGLIYFDPPWGDAPWFEFLNLAASRMAAEGLILVEHPRRIPVEAPPSLTMMRMIRVGEAQVSLFRGAGDCAKMRADEG